jgi:putative peptide zinc metalloprotease protein
MNGSVAQRPVALRKRPDLISEACRIGKRLLWRVKDPVSLEYFEFSEQEYAILEMLDGSATLSSIQRSFEKSFVPLQLGLGPLQQFLYRLHEAGLVLATTPGQGDNLLQRRRLRGQREFLSGLFNILAFRLRGIDPQHWLDWLHERLSWIYSAWFAIACGMLVAAAATLVTVQFDLVCRRLPAMDAFLTPANVIWLALVLAAAKGVHELAHGLTCRHFGGECHELGLMFLVFTPCLYCNVSDAWMLAGRRERILISLAGVIAEVVLASCCAFLWWFSQPGLFNSICLDVMLVCSVSTVAFNANPLLRYDGYFVLSDLLQESNLSQKSQRLLRQTVQDWFGGIPWNESSWRTFDKPLSLALYGVLSSAYRVFVMVMIFWFAYSFFKARDLPSVGWVVVMLGSAGVLAAPLAGLVAVVNDPSVRLWFNRRRVLRIIAGLGALCLAAAWLPVPQRVAAELVLEAPAAAHVYVHVGGRLEQMVPAGTHVRRGEILARLVNHQLLRDIETTRGARNQARQQVELLEASRLDDPAAAAQIPAAREALAGFDRRLAQQCRDEERLVLRAPTDGVVLPPPYRDQGAIRRPALPGWRGTPLEEINAGCWLETGTLLCQVGDPRKIEPVLLIDQSDIDLIRPGQSVRMCLDEYPAAVLTGTITEIAGDTLEILPRQSDSARNVPSRIDPAGNQRPIEATYLARVALDVHSPLLLLRGHGKARIRTTAAPLAQRLYRALRKTFHFQL